MVSFPGYIPAPTKQHGNKIYFTKGGALPGAMGYSALERRVWRRGTGLASRREAGLALGDNGQINKLMYDNQFFMIYYTIDLTASKAIFRATAICARFTEFFLP